MYDGIFFMSLEDYLKNFELTTICVASNEAEYKHSQLYHTFDRDCTGSKQAFFSFTLTQPIDCRMHAFSISVMQQGERLKNYK